MHRTVAVAAITAGLALVGSLSPAEAHPHVWVTATAEITYEPDGAAHAIKHRWSFDEAYSAFATQGLDANGDGRLSREELAERLRAYNERLTDAPAVRANIDALANPDSLCVIGGQQAGFLGGPLFTTYKILSVLRAASWLADRLGTCVVPIFWLATEDHDFTEINRIRLLDPSGDLRTISFDWDGRGRPVERLPITAEVRAALDGVRPGLHLSIDVVPGLENFDLAALTSDDAADLAVIMGYGYRTDRNHWLGHGLRYHGGGAGFRPGEVQKAGRGRLLQDHQYLDPPGSEAAGV